MSKEEVIEYVMTTPGNPNRAVLSGMLDSIADAGGGSSRVLLYEREINITNEYNGWLYYEFSGLNGENLLFSGFNKDTGGNWVLVVDGEELSEELRDYHAIGADNPGLEHGTYKIGCNVTTAQPKAGTQIFYVQYVSRVVLDKDYFTAGTHSVKIYKEL